MILFWIAAGLLFLILSTKREKYTFICKEERAFFHPKLKGLIAIDHPYFSLGLDGIITMKENYAYDGCTFKFILFNCFQIGISDGPINFSLCRKWLEYESGWHDILCQIPQIPRSLKDQVFKDAMLQIKFQFWRRYYFATRFFAYLTFQWK